VKDAADSKARLEAVLANEAGPSRDIVIMNAAAALYVSGVAASLWDGVALARDALASGAARAKLDQLVKFTRGFAKAG
jgi:anthranilate phosphoribosyltransferase